MMILVLRLTTISLEAALLRPHPALFCVHPSQGPAHFDDSAFIVVDWIKANWHKLGVDFSPPDLVTDGNKYDVCFGFSTEVLLLPSNDLHLGGALFLSLLSALTGWKMRPKVRE